MKLCQTLLCKLRDEGFPVHEIGDYRKTDLFATPIKRIADFQGLYPVAHMSTDFGKRLQTARRHAGLTQKQLAAAVDLAQSTVAELEKNGFGSSKTLQIAQACRVSGQWLATGEGPMEPGIAGESPQETAPPTSKTEAGKSLDVGLGAAVVAERLAELLDPLDEAARAAVAQHLDTLTRAPDSRKAREALARSLGSSSKPRVSESSGLPGQAGKPDFLK